MSKRNHAPAAAAAGGGGFSFKRYLHAHPTTTRVSVGLCVVCMVVGLSVGLGRVFNAAAVERQDAKDAVDAYAAGWRIRINTRFSEAISVATSAAIFVAGAATTVPNHNGTRAERIQLVDAARWDAQGYWLFRHVPGLLAVELQPSGIIAQNYPADNSTLGFDVMSHPAYSAEYRAIATTGENTIHGPHELVQGGWGLLARAPVFLGPAASGWETFWGTATLAFRIADVLAGMNFSASLGNDGYDYTAVRQHSTNRSAPVDVIMSSRPQAPQSVAVEGTSFAVRLHGSGNTLAISIARAAPLPRGSPSAALVAGIVGAVTSLSALVVALIFAGAFAAFTMRHGTVPHPYRGASSSAEAGEDTIMALVSVKSMTWWKDHGDPERLQSDLAKFRHETERIARSHGCHLSGCVSDGCALIVADDAVKLRKFATAIRSGLVVSSVASIAEQDAAGGGGGQDTPRSSRSRRSRRSRSSSQASHMSESSTLPGHFVTADFAIAVAMHIGRLRSSYDPSSDHVSFHGPAAIATAARAVDATRGGEVSATEDFVAEHADVCGPPRRSETIDGEEEMVLSILEQPAVPEYPLGLDLDDPADDDWKHHNEDAAATATAVRDRRRVQSENDSAVATSLSATTGAVLRKVVAVLHLEILPAKKQQQRRRRDADDDDDINEGGGLNFKMYANVLRAIDAAVQLHKGEVTATTGSTATVLFNARVPATDPWSRAVHADDRVRLEMQRHGGLRVVSAVSTGLCLVATVGGTHIMCVGDAVTRALRLHAHLIDVVRADEHPAPRSSNNSNNNHGDCESPLALESDGDDASTTPSSEAGVGASGGPLVPELPMLRTCVVDAASADILRRRFEVQCLGTFGSSASLGSSLQLLAYAVEREWEGADQGDEWLYRMHQMEEQSVFAGVNRAFEALHANPADAEARTAARAVVAERSARPGSLPAVLEGDDVPTPGPSVPYSVHRLADALRRATAAPSGASPS